MLVLLRRFVRGASRMRHSDFIFILRAGRLLHSTTQGASALPGIRGTSEARDTVLWITRPVRKCRTKWGGRTPKELSEGGRKLLQLRGGARLRTLLGLKRSNTDELKSGAGPRDCKNSLDPQATVTPGSNCR